MYPPLTLNERAAFYSREVVTVQVEVCVFLQFTNKWIYIYKLVRRRKRVFQDGRDGYTSFLCCCRSDGATQSFLVSMVTPLLCLPGKWSEHHDSSCLDKCIVSLHGVFVRTISSSRVAQIWKMDVWLVSGHDDTTAVTEVTTIRQEGALADQSVIGHLRGSSGNLARKHFLFRLCFLFKHVRTVTLDVRDAGTWLDRDGWTSRLQTTTWCFVLSTDLEETQTDYKDDQSL